MLNTFGNVPTPGDIKAPTPKDMTANAGAKSKIETVANFKASGKRARELAYQDNPNEMAMEGTKSHEIAFVCTLGDPTAPRYIMGPADPVSHKPARIPSNLVVGYQFKALADVEVPVKQLVGKNLYKTEPVGTRLVKAGEIFSLNIMETAELISRIEYAGYFTGEDQKVFLSVVAGKNDTLPHPVLKSGVPGSGTIKSNMTMIADIIDGKPVLKPDFAEMYANYYVKKPAGSKTTVKAQQAGDGARDLAAAFRALCFND